MTETLPQNTARAGIFGAALATVTSACCILPMALMLFGIGGSTAAIFGQMAALSVYVLPLSVAMIALAWLVAIRRKSVRRLRVMLVSSSLMSVVALGVYFWQGAITDLMIGWM